MKKRAGKRGRISFREVRVYCEVKAFFPDAILDYKLGQRLRVDMYIPSENVSVEYDGCYWHKDRETQDKNKNGAITKAGSSVIRMREKPLTSLLKNDIVCDFRNLLPACRELASKLGKDVSGYVAFRGDVLYDETISNIFRGIVLNNLKEAYPNIASDWDNDKNPLGPDSVSFGSAMMVWWKCSNGHSWRASVCNRSLRGSGCPYCSACKVDETNNLAVTYPNLACEWDIDKNESLPESVSWSQPNNVWWKCQTCGHSWRQLVISRVRYIDRKYGGCPNCRRKLKLREKSLAARHPALVKEWDTEKNSLIPCDVFSSDSIMVWWKCTSGHSWKANLKMRVKRRNKCPQCRRDK